MPKAVSSAAAREKFLKMLVRAAFSDSDHERHAAIDAAHKFAVRYGLKTDAVGVSSGPRAPSIDDVMRAGDKVRSVAADENVQKIVTGVGAAVQGLRDILGKR